MELIMGNEKDETIEAEDGSETSRVGIVSDVMRQTLIDIKEWDIGIFMQKGKYVLPRRLRRQIQKALGSSS